jgi:hypothetical protein
VFIAFFFFEREDVVYIAVSLCVELQLKMRKKWAKHRRRTEGLKPKRPSNAYGPKIEKEICLGQNNRVTGPIKEILLIFRLFHQAHRGLEIQTL